MGEMADKHINGELCAVCGVYLEPGEWVYLQHHDGTETQRMQMPADGSPAGVPVLCNDCNNNEK